MQMLREIARDAELIEKNPIDIELVAQLLQVK